MGAAGLFAEISLPTGAIANQPNMKTFVIIFREGTQPLTEADKQRRTEETVAWARRQNAAGLNNTALEHLIDLWRYLRTRSSEFQGSYQVTDTIERIGGQPPKSLQQFLAEQAHLFSVSSQATETAP